MLQPGYMSVLEARSVDALRHEIVRFANQLEFECVAATAVTQRPFGEPEFITVNNIPEAYLAKSVDPQRARRDPVAQHCKRSSVPIAWSRDTYVAAGLDDQWEEQAPFGFATGISLALHLPEGRHFMFGVDRSAALPDSPAALTRLVADLQLFAVHAWEAAVRLLLPGAPVVEPPSLSPRELECLRWTMEGKTAWELGSILGVSERTVTFHITNVVQKLDCATKHQAVIKAMRLGLIR